MITYDDFKKVEMRVGKILAAEPVEKSDKLLKLSVDFGLKSAVADSPESEQDVRQVVSGIAKSYKPEEIIGKQFVFVINLEPRSIMGLESQAMILAANSENGSVALQPEKTVVSGATIQ